MPAGPNPADPRTWWRGLVDAVAGLQRGDKTPAADYLRFVQQHRTRAIAEVTRQALLRLRDDAAFKDCHLWIANGYQPSAKKRTRG